MRRDGDWLVLRAALAISDALCLLAAFAIASWLASQPALGGHNVDDHRIFILLMLPVLFAIFLTQGLYQRDNLLGGTREYAAVLRACTYGLVALTLASFALRRQVSREWLVLFWAAAALLTGSARFALRRLAYTLRRRGYLTRRAILVGADQDSVALAMHLATPGSGIEVVGFLDEYLPAGSVLGGNLRVLGRPTALRQLAAKTQANEVIVVPQALPWEALQTLMTNAVASANGLPVHLSAGFYDLLTTSVRLSEQNHVPLLTVNKAVLTPFEQVFKLALDYGLSTALLILFSPALLVTAVTARMRGIDHVLERRRVIGRHGIRFDQLSFSAAAVSRWEFLRKLPGLLNVFGGDLSLVGPRPISESEAHTSSRRAKILTIRPGLTGPWRQADDPEEQALLDLYYIRSYSLWVDLHVLIGRLGVHTRRALARCVPGLRSAGQARRVPEAAR
jgi:lipopolysaccharide/colanic/teichoic acid biosynthesis glycosyltransferase